MRNGNNWWTEMKHSTYLVSVGCLVFLVCTFFFTLITLDPISWLVIYEKTDLVPGTVSYAQWKEPKIDIYFQAYMFNLTNPEEFVGGAKPRVQQVGPYTYREHRIKTDMSEQHTGSTIEYRERIYYYFVPELSVGPESDVVTTVNLAYIQIDVQFGWLPAAVDRVIELLENRTEDYLITTRTVRELLWGYEDPFLRFLYNMFIPVPTTMIGLYWNKNGTERELTEIYRNNKDQARFGQVYKFQGQTKLSVWTTSEANKLNGSDGSLFHPFLQWKEQPYVFTADICRSIQLRPTSEVKFAGVPVYRYLPFEDTFRSALNTEKNRGFCLNWPNCLKDNVHDMTTCMPGAPIVMSLPHLMHADPEYQNAVEGLHPNDDLNTSFLIEPKTGVVFKAQKKLQINARVKNNPKFRELSLVHNVFLPVMFMNESFTIDTETVSSLRLSVYTGPIVVKTILSILLIVCALILFVIVARKYWYAGSTPTNVPYQELSTGTAPETQESV
ncbi:unnamed protein product [Echinostoma caproni]|uniref:Scavenger receptor class B member 1 n=1 Tax=Echinostoma caproni TaxID=27848 RepID=A0A183AM28_9TREM|nr:unnamed protein product [Echinostoma caproni]